MKGRRPLKKPDWNDPKQVAKLHCKFFGHTTTIGKKCVCGTWVSMMKAGNSPGTAKTANPDQDLREKDGYF